MTNPTYTDEQVLDKASAYRVNGFSEGATVLESLLADRQRLQADCITYWNHVAELQAKVSGLRAEVEAFKDGVTIRDYFAIRCLPQWFGTGSPDSRAKASYADADAMLQARATTNETSG